MTSEEAWRRRPPSDVWQMVLSAFAMAQGARWFMYPGLFAHDPNFRFINQFALSQPCWAALMVAYSILGLIGLKGSLRTRVAIWVFGALLWIFLGMEVIAGAATAGRYSVLGVFEALNGIGLIFRVVLWARRRG